MVASVYELIPNTDLSQRMGSPTGDWTPPVDPPEPLADPVTDLVAVAQGETTINLGWSATANAVSYLIWRSPNNLDWSFIDTTTGLGYLDTGRSPDTTYWYQVWPINIEDQATSEGNNIASATTDAEEVVPPTDSIPVNQLYSYRTISVTEDGDPDVTGRNRSQPTSLENAMITAAAGDIVGLDEGIYTGNPDTSLNQNDRANQPTWEVMVSGTQAKPIVFVAKNLAALVSSNYSEIRSGYAQPPNWNNGHTGSPAFGTTFGRGRKYIHFIGFYLNEGNPNSQINDDTGLLALQNADYFKIRYCKFIGQPSSESGDGHGNNYSAIRQEKTLEIEVTDCHFEDWSMYGDSVTTNCTGTTMYNSYKTNMLNNYFEHCGHAIHYKEDDPDQGERCEGGKFNYNRAHDCAVWMKTSNPSFTDQTRPECKHNLLTDIDMFFGWHEDPRTGSSHACNWDVFNNTITFGSHWNSPELVNYCNTGGSNRNNYMWNNIYVGPTHYYQSWSSSFINGDSGKNAMGNNTHPEYNCLNGVSDVFGGDIPDVSFAYWQSLGWDYGSITSDPQFVGGGNYRLQGGSPAENGKGGINMGCYVTGNEVIGIRDGNEGSGIESP